MTTVPEDRLHAALLRHGDVMTAEQWIAVLDDVVGATDVLTAPEQEFLAAHGGLDQLGLSTSEQPRAMQRVALATQRAYAEVAHSGLSTTEVMATYGYARPNVHRMVANDDLYAVALPRHRELLFPGWQFIEAGPLEGLHEVLPRIPAEYHPLDVADFMTTRDEALNQRSPAEWLASGGLPQSVADLVDELSML